MILNLLVKLLQLLPHRLTLAFGRFVGRILRLVLWQKVDRCEARCVKSLGVGITTAREIIKLSFINLAMSAVEFIRLPVIKPVIKNYVSFDKESVRTLHEALSRGHGVILMSSHMANWEYAAIRVIAEGFPLHVLYTPQRNQGGANDIIMKIRAQSPEMAMIDNKGAGLREIFRVLKAGGIIVIMQDLDARRDGVITNFLGLPASTHDGIIKLHEKFKCPIVPVHYKRDWKNPTQHSVTMPEILSDRPEFDLETCNRVIEEWIKEEPGQWFWLMDRWEYTLGKKA